MKQDTLRENNGILHLLPSILFYQAIGMILTLLFTFALALLISGGFIPPGARNITALCCIPGSFLAGFLTAGRTGRRILPMGLLSGGLFFLLLLLISVVFLPGLHTWTGFFGILAACIAGSVTGALCTMGMHRR